MVQYGWYSMIWYDMILYCIVLCRVAVHCIIVLHCIALCCCPRNNMQIYVFYFWVCDRISKLQLYDLDLRLLQYHIWFPHY